MTIFSSQFCAFQSDSMRHNYLLFLLIWTFQAALVAQSPKSLFESLYGLEAIKITLTYPYDSLYRTNQDEIDAIISIESKNGFLLKNEPLSLNLRGKFRRMKCDMPPLLLNFKKSTLRDLDLNDIDEIKLVTHCLETSEGQENLQEEFFCYQLYETLTPYAYRTIWLEVTYIDALHPERQFRSAGFFIEPDKDISRRLGVIERKLFNVAPDSLDYATYATAAAFNFLIGNRDWSIVMSRNAKLFFSPIGNQYIVIPYDYDYSNLVGASYRRETRPEDMLHTYDRIYQGEYFPDRAGDILKLFLDSEGTIMGSVYSVSNPMDEDQRKKIAKYFQTWFDMVRKKDPKDMPYGFLMPYKGGL